MGKLCKLETFFCLMWDFFVAKLRWLNIRQHTFARLCIVLFNSSITLTTIKAKVFILIKDWIAFPVFTHGSGSDFLCFLEWLIDWLTDWLFDWLIDWLTDWLTNDQLTNELTNQQTDWRNIFTWLLLVLWITCSLGMHFKFKINALIYLKVWILLAMFQHLFKNILLL